MDEQLLAALMKKALGYTAVECEKEYAVDGETGERRLIKVRDKLKEQPPDIAAARLIYEITEKQSDVSKWTSEELAAELERLNAEAAETGNDE